VSQWISKALIPKGKGIEHHVRGRTPWRSRIVDLTVPHVCDDCNHHWMSDLESVARNGVLSLLRGESVILNERNQRMVASWCFMKVITAELGRPADEAATYPPFIYEGFKEFKRPANGCAVTIGAMEPSDSRLVWFQSEGQIRHDLPAPIGEAPAYHTSFVIGQLVVDVLGILDPRVHLHPEDDERFVQIWPVRPEPVAWPPIRRFVGIENNRLI
jgi:hypothetical protein